jgi:hypothetical protein
VTLRPDVAHAGGRRHRSTDAGSQAPVDVLRSARRGRVVVADVGRRRCVAWDGQLNPGPEGRPGGASRALGIRRECALLLPPHWSHRAAGRSSLGLAREAGGCPCLPLYRRRRRLRCRWGVHDAVAGADNGLGIDLIGEAEARTQVLVIVVDRRAAVAGIGSGTGKLQAPLVPVTGLARLGLKKLILSRFDEGRKKS